MTVADIGACPQVATILRGPRERLSNIVSRLAHQGYLASTAIHDGVVWKKKTKYFFGANCRTPAGERTPPTWTADIDARAAARRTPLDRSPAVESETHHLIRRQINADRAEIPSRVGDWLVYRSGRRVHIDHEFAEQGDA